MPAATKYHLLADLVSTLEADGFVVGTGKHLQVQELLSKLPDDIALESLKTLLAPVFVTTRQDQLRFYELFDLCLRRVRELEETRREVLAPKSYDVERWRNIVLILFLVLAGWAGYILEWNLFKWWGNPTFLLLLALAGGGIYFAFQGLRRTLSRVLYIALLIAVVAGGQMLKRILLPDMRPQTTFVLLNVEPGSTLTLSVPLKKEQRLQSIAFCNGSQSDTSAAFGSSFVDTLGNLTIIAKDSFSMAIRDSICILTTYPTVRDTTYFIATYTPPIVEKTQEETDPPEPEVLDTLPIPFPQDIAELEIDPDQQRKAEFYKKNAWWLKLLIISLFGAILWSIAKWREKKQGRLVAQLEQRDKPPYIWNIRSEQREDLLFSDSARVVLNQLRRRRLEDAYRLDINKTIAATVRSAGRVAFQFKQQTSPSEYLMLIDRQALNDHRAVLFDQLYQAFKLNEVNVVRLFYYGDPRLCFNRRYPNGLSIKELQHRFGNARLLIIGNGYELLSPGTGGLSRWASIFTNWRERALFTPKPIGLWDQRERQLAEHFYLMPASVESLAATLEEFGNQEPRSPQELIPTLEDVQWRPIEFQRDVISALRTHYDEHMLQWIAACAVYPHLQWDITLFLGRELSPGSDSLLTIENLLKLTRIPWFVEGRIPDTAREELLNYLASQGLEQRIRERLHWLLEHAPKPSSDTVAFDEYRINALGNEWRFTQNRSRRRELEEELTSYYAAGHNLDQVVFKYLHRERSRLDFEAPETWKRYIFNKGEAFFGLRNWVWAMPLWVLLTMMVLFFNPQYKLCTGERQSWMGKEICLAKATDYLIYYEYQIRDAIARQDLRAADSLLQYARSHYYTTGMLETRPDATPQTPITQATRPVATDTTAFVRNLAIHYYNAGVKLYNQWWYFNDSIRIEIGREETRPQQQEDADMQTERLLKYQQWRMISDSLAKASCDNLQRGSRLFTNATRGAGYDFILAMQKICPEVPRETPQEERFTGTVLDADSNRPVANVTVRALNGNISVRTTAKGLYELPLPASLRDSFIRLEFSAKGYAAHTEELRVQQPLTPVALEPIRQAKETLEIFTASNGMRGLRTNTNRTVLPARYYNIELDPASGLYRVQQMRNTGLEMGYVDAQGKIVIPIEYRVLGFLRDGLILAAKERYGYLDRHGKIAISFIYEGANDFNRGEAEVIQLLEGQRFTFTINKEGRCIRSCPPEDSYIRIKSATVEQQMKFAENIPMITLYFDLDAPESGSRATDTRVSYTEVYAELLKNKNRFSAGNMVQQNVLDTRAIDDFFAGVQTNYERFNEALGTVATYLQNTKGQVEITLRGYAMGSGAASVYNQILSARRISAVRNSINTFNKNELQRYLRADRIRIIEEPLGDSRAPAPGKGNTDLSGRSLNTLRENRVEVIIRFAN